MIKHIFIEEEVKDYEQTLKVLTHFKKTPKSYIDKVENYFGKVKKPYLQKRENLNLYLGAKKGDIVKEAPDAYGMGQEKHFYFIHQYNCIYECEYCYLQGYFNSPDIVFFTNQNDILKAIENKLQEYPDCWMHAGEFSDSLALNALTDEWLAYWNLFERYPLAKLELRTKSHHIKNLLKLKPLPNTIITFSLSSEQNSIDLDRKTPNSLKRIEAINKLVQSHFRIGVHFDPLVLSEKFEEQYREVIQSLAQVLPNANLAYISIGVIRFSKDSYRQVTKNYPESKIHLQQFQSGYDDKYRYKRPIRLWMIAKIEQLLLEVGYEKEKIYRCMEE